jgi:hypothetical protein
MAWHHNRNLRLVGLVAAIGWFLYWGHSAYISAKAHDQAEAARFEAESRRDWASGQMHEQTSAAAIQDLIRSIGWGFFIPLALLVAGEVDAGGRRIRRRDAQSKNK